MEALLSPSTLWGHLGLCMCRVSSCVHVSAADVVTPPGNQSALSPPRAETVRLVEASCWGKFNHCVQLTVSSQAVLLLALYCRQRLITCTVIYYQERCHVSHP